jgi:ketosteroid isomerase-like protein
MRGRRPVGHGDRMTNTLESTTPVDVVGGLYAAFARGDMDGLLALVDPEVDWSVQVDAPGAELVPMFRNGRGHDAVLGYFAGVANMEIHSFEPRAFHPSGDEVLVEIAIDFTCRSTGKRGRFDEIHHWVVRDGLVVRYRPFLDTATYIEVWRP